MSSSVALYNSYIKSYNSYNSYMYNSYIKSYKLKAILKY